MMRLARRLHPGQRDTDGGSRISLRRTVRARRPETYARPEWFAMLQS